MIRKILLSLFTCALFTSVSIAQDNDPVKIGVVGLVHGHVHWILGYEGKDIEVVGIVEPNRSLAKRLANQYGFSMDIVYDNIDKMLDEQHPEAVTAFTSIYDHLKVVKKCAPKGVHVMVEKPLAVNLVHAKQMEALANEYNIHLITNYETTWYASNQKVFSMVQEDKLGSLRKIVVHDGHQGPKEIGVSNEFLEWLTDPELNGGGAVIDFGCYGADLITWLMKGQKPQSVTAVTQQIKPDVYPEVDDEATIVVTYPEAQGIIQASWNWPFSRKDMEVYGKSGYVMADNSTDIRYRLAGQDDEIHMSEEPRSDPYDNPFSYFAAVINGDIDVRPDDLSSLETNMTVVEILDAAVQSAKTGKTIYLK